MTFESAPFEECPYCGRDNSFGILSIGGSSYSKRCRYCRESETFSLPSLEKKVIYLDQFVISNLMKAKSGLFRQNVPEAEQVFWTMLYQKVKRLVLLQGALFPDSLIHFNESVASPFYQELKTLQDHISGGISLQDEIWIETKQLGAFALAWIRNQPIPALSFDVDSILMGRRNVWLDRFLITTDRNITEETVSGIRASREQTHRELADVFSRWQNDRQNDFSQHVIIEADAFGRCYREGIVRHFQRLIDINMGISQFELIDLLGRPIAVFSLLSDAFRSNGVNDADMIRKVSEFLQWDGLHSMPLNHIQSYLFAAIRRKALSGQRMPPNQGTMSDITMVSAYMPYCDAMFIDNGFAALLAERPLSDDLIYQARIFCPNSRDQFVAYLSEIEQGIPADVKEIASHLYGISIT